MSEIIPYTVETPKRWPDIANLAYGDPGKIDELLRANPNIEIEAVIPEGTILNIPIILEDTETIVSNDLLPPWKRV